MATIKIKTPDGKTISLNAPEGASPDIIKAKAQQAVEAYKTQSSGQQPSAKQGGGVGQAVNSLINTALPGPGALINQVANLNPTARRVALTAGLGEMGQAASPLAAGAGAALGGTLADAADDPKAAVGVAGRLGKVAADVAVAPQNIMGDAANVASPSDAAEFAAKRAAEFASAAIPAGIAKGLSSVRAAGPFTAALNEPGLGIPGGPKRALEALGAAKTAARAGEDLGDASRLRKMLSTPGGRIKLSEEAIAASKSGQEVSATQALAYREALGKVQDKGGTFAGDYRVARQYFSSELERLAPGLMKKMGSARKAFLALGRGNEPTGLIEAVANPVANVAKALAFPGARAAAGALTRASAEAAVPTATASLAALESLRKARKKK
jgi:hypothetical protein